MNVRRNSSPSPSTLSCPTTAIAKKPWEEQSQVLDVIISSKEKWVAQVIKVRATLHLILWFYFEPVILNNSNSNLSCQVQRTSGGLSAFHLART